MTIRASAKQKRLRTMGLMPIDHGQSYQVPAASCCMCGGVESLKLIGDLFIHRDQRHCGTRSSR